MMTFKKFLEAGDPLEDVEKMMVLRKMVPELTNDDAEEILDWFGNIQGSYDDLPDALSQKLADSDFAQTDIEGKDISQLPDHKAAPIVRGKLQNMMHDFLNRARLKEGALDDLEHELKLRSLYNINQEDAEILLSWAREGGVDGSFWDMSEDATNKVMDAHIHELESSRGPLKMDALADKVMQTSGIPYNMDSRFADI